MLDKTNAVNMSTCGNDNDGIIALLLLFSAHLARCPPPTPASKKQSHRQNTATLFFRRIALFPTIHTIFTRNKHNTFYSWHSKRHQDRTKKCVRSRLESCSLIAQQPLYANCFLFLILQERESEQSERQLV